MWQPLSLPLLVTLIRGLLIALKDGLSLRDDANMRRDSQLSSSSTGPVPRLHGNSGQRPGRRRRKTFAAENNFSRAICGSAEQERLGSAGEI
ncbi:hypothetical protein NDU88_003260 [Pleurodeles waltl]|uniref:Secreted protein n=1 Tax=Pleurodeles waltl TaxID=8319 RepID=A0AAV7MQ26_PLEWA|nr:hypothetical protein NDU88_003260 [Pleurodeles waltl]